jgi:hypothetical protein
VGLDVPINGGDTGGMDVGLIRNGMPRIGPARLMDGWNGIRERKQVNRQLHLDRNRY